MNAAEYFELVDAVTKIDGKTQLLVVADRIATTAMHPLERRVLERALRARTEALDLHSCLLASELVRTSVPEKESFLARG